MRRSSLRSNVALDLAERTVKAHLTAAFTKLGARDRLHLSLIVNRLL